MKFKRSLIALFIMSNITANIAAADSETESAQSSSKIADECPVPYCGYLNDDGDQSALFFFDTDLKK